METIAIRNSLRTESSEDLDRRRKVIALSAVGLIDFCVLSLYQTGVIKKLPDIPLPVFDSNKVNASKDAYPLGVPDSPISATVYGLTMVLASAGGSKNTGRRPILDVMLGSVIAGNALGGIYYLYNMAFKQKKICLYCVTGAVINVVSAAIIAPAVMKSFKKMLT